MSTHIYTCFTHDYQVVRPRLWNRRVLRIKTHLDSKLEHGNVGQLLWKHRISRAILRRGPSQDDAEAIRRLCFTYQNACQLIFLRVLRSEVGLMSSEPPVAKNDDKACIKTPLFHQTT